MQEDAKIEHAIRGLQAFLQQLSPRDLVGLLYFNDELHEGVKMAPFATNAKALRATVAQVRERFATWGLTLPRIPHSELGTV